MAEMLEVVREQYVALEREKEMRWELERQLSGMRLCMEELWEKLEELEKELEEDRLDSIDVEGLLEGFDVEEDDEHFDPTNTFRERDQELDQGNSRRDQTE